MSEGAAGAGGGKEVGAAGGRDAASESENDTVGEDRPQEYTHVKAPPPTSTSREEEGEQADSGTGGSRPQDTTEVLSPTEKKRRRLESNRAAAKRAYYRRQSKIETIQQENDALQTQLEAERFKVAIFRNLLRRLGVNPEVALAAITGHTVPAASLAAAAAVQIQSQQLGAGNLRLGAQHSATASLNASGAAAGLPVSRLPTGGSAEPVSEEPAEQRSVGSGFAVATPLLPPPAKGAPTAADPPPASGPTGSSANGTVTEGPAEQRSVSSGIAVAKPAAPTAAGPPA